MRARLFLRRNRTQTDPRSTCVDESCAERARPPVFGSTGIKTLAAIPNKGNTIIFTRTRLLAGTAAASALVVVGIGASAASASTAQYENHTYRVSTHRVINVECSHGRTYLNFTTTADPAKGQVVETGLLFKHHQTVGMTLNVKGPITFSIALLCQ
jgi:hypothetical protein